MGHFNPGVKSLIIYEQLRMEFDSLHIPNVIFGSSLSNINLHKCQLYKESIYTFCIADRSTKID